MSIHVEDLDDLGGTIYTMFIELKWTRTLHPLWSKADEDQRPKTYITFDGRDTKLPADAFSCIWLEAVCEAMWYVYAGSILSSTRHGIAIFNEYFVRIIMIKDAVGKNVLAVEAHPAVALAAAHTPSRPVISFQDFLACSHHDNMWQHPPNPLFAYSAAGVRHADDDAFARLSAFIHLGFFLAATAMPTSPDDTTDDSPHIIDANPHHANPHQGRQVIWGQEREDNPSGSPGDNPGSPDLHDQDDIEGDDSEMCDSSGDSTRDNPCEYLLVANVSVLLLHPSEMDALTRHTHSGSVRAPSADLHDWFLWVESSSRTSSTPR